LLTLTTIARRIVVPAIAFLVWTPVAHAWSWPVQGPVVQPFVYDETHPYAAGQHRGIDIGADSAGEAVRAPSDGTVSFAGTVPTSGKSITIETPDGYSVTLTHLGSIEVADGAVLAEGDVVGTIGPSGTAETDVPYIHLGIRVASDPNGYLDPLSLLPSPTAATGGSDNGSTTTQPVATGGAAASPAPASQPAPAQAAITPATTSQGSPVRAGSGRAARHVRGRVQRSRQADARPQGTRQRSQLSQPAQTERPVQHRPRTPHHRVSEPLRASRRPVVEAAATHESIDLDAGHAARPSIHVADRRSQTRHEPSSILGLACNGVAAVVALLAARAAARRRARDLAGRVTIAHVLRLPRPSSVDRDVRRAA
jgi:peptidase M23-like protein